MLGDFGAIPCSSVVYASINHFAFHAVAFLFPASWRLWGKCLIALLS